MMKFKIMILLCKPRSDQVHDPYLLYGFVSNTGKFYAFGEKGKGFLQYSLIQGMIEDLSNLFNKSVAYDTIDDYGYNETDLSEYDEIVYEETIYVP